MTLSQNSLNNQAHWSVYWFGKGRWKRKRFRTEYDSALKWYIENLHRTGITLHSDNVAFPAPRRLTHYEETQWRVVTKKGKKYKKRYTVVTNRMRELNARGIWWCPYCIKLRRFREIRTDRGVETYCPVCTVSNYLMAVRQHNPKAVIIEHHKPQRSPRGRRRRRRKVRESA